MPKNLVRYQKCGVFHFITIGFVEIESEWTSRRREVQNAAANEQYRFPPFAKNAKDGAPAMQCKQSVGHPPISVPEQIVVVLT
jgi:hypothetical protein